MKIRSTDVCLKTLQIYGKSKTAIWAELCKRSFSAINHRGYSILNKHLLRKTQNFFCPLCIFKGRSLFLRLLKLAFFARRRSQSAFNNFIYSLRFRPKVQDLLEAILFVVAQECCNQNCASLMGHISKTWCEFINRLTFVNAYSILLHTKLWSIFPGMKTFYFWVALEIVNLCFLQSALRTFDSTLCRFPSWWLEVPTHHGSLLSQHCIAYWISASSDEMEPALFKIL